MEPFLTPEVIEALAASGDLVAFAIVFYLYRIDRGLKALEEKWIALRERIARLEFAHEIKKASEVALS